MEDLRPETVTSLNECTYYHLCKHFDIKCLLNLSFSQFDNQHLNSYFNTSFEKKFLAKQAHKITMDKLTYGKMFKLANK